jgi:DNA polymerase III delta prime subunit
MISELFTEKFRPSKFEHLILPDRINKILKGGEIHQNILLFGSAGTGKTSTAKVLVNAPDIASLYINISDESSVDTIRDKITKFCSEISVLDGSNARKVIILDEMDGASDQFYKALRGTIEKFINCRFIGTCNFVNKIPEPIQSRFEMINFDFINKDEENEVKKIWEDRIARILKALGIKFDQKALLEFVDRYFPDMRTVLNKIQGFQLSGVKELTAEKIREQSWDFQDIYKLIFSKQNPIENYKFIVGNYSSKVDDVMHALGSEFIDWIEENSPKAVVLLPVILVLVASHQEQRSKVIDPVVSLCSLIFQIQTQVNKTIAC